MSVPVGRKRLGGPGQRPKSQFEEEVRSQQLGGPQCLAGQSRRQVLPGTAQQPSTDQLPAACARTHTAISRHPKGKRRREVRTKPPKV